VTALSGTTLEPGLFRLPGRIVFGRGALADAAAETSRIARHALLCTDENIARTTGFAQLVDDLAREGVTTYVFDRTPPEVPCPSVDECLQAVGGAPIDAVIGFGGGSSMDMAKACALLATHGGPLERYYGEGGVPSAVLPVVAIPTTAGTGSEVTPVAVVSDPAKSLKVGISSTHLIPAVAICDPELTLSCPPHVTAYSGVDALIHAVEAYLAPPRTVSSTSVDVFRGRTAFTGSFALRAVQLIGGALERAVADGSDIESREQMLFASLSAGMAFGHAGTAGAHALQYPVGAATKTPHGLGVALLAPYVLEYVRPAALPQLRDVADALGIDVVGRSEDQAASAAIDEMARLAHAVGIPVSLAEIGVGRDDLPQLAAEALTIGRLLRNSPRPLDLEGLTAILEAAWNGDRAALRG
jgi:alcohol dehydrogenase